MQTPMDTSTRGGWLTALRRFTPPPVGERVPL